MDTLSGRYAVILGGSGGIGAHVVKKLAEAGVSIGIHGRHWHSGFDRLIQETASLVPCTGFTEEFSETLSPFSERVSAEIQRADILCICFGPFLQKPLCEMSVADWNRVVQFNYTMPGIMISSVLPEMMKKKWGRILVFGGTRTSSINGFITNAAYAGAKTALCSLVKSVASEYAEYGITCNAVLPGFVDTEYLSETLKASLREKMPLKELISSDCIADAALFLLSHSEMNGVLLTVDGGWDPAFSKNLRQV